MKVAIVGSRGWSDRFAIKEYVRKFPEGTVVVSGGAKGADQIGVRFAKERGLQTEVILPEWDRLGKQAGIIRNREIISRVEMVIAFWDGSSKGTKHSIDLALAAENVHTVIVVKEKDDIEW